MFTATSRLLTFLCAVLYAVLGAFLFLNPESLAPVFAWKVTPFMAMTIGGWCLGNAWLAWVCAWRWEWKLVYSALLYLWLFGVLETMVVIRFYQKLNMTHNIAWLYLAALIVNDLAAIAGFMDWLRLRPTRDRFGPQAVMIYKVAVVLFILFVGFLGMYGMTAQAGAPGTNGGIFPEVMSPFTLRSFGVFYFSLALGVVPLLWDRNLNTLLNHSLASYGLIVFITAAAFVYLDLFNFTERPGGLAYFGAYLAVGIPLLFVFLFRGTGSRKEP